MHKISFHFLGLATQWKVRGRELGCCSFSSSSFTVLVPSPWQEKIGWDMVHATTNQPASQPPASTLQKCNPVTSWAHDVISNSSMASLSEYRSYTRRQNNAFIFSSIVLVNIENAKYDSNKFKFQQNGVTFAIQTLAGHIFENLPVAELLQNSQRQ